MISIPEPKFRDFYFPPNIETYHLRGTPYHLRGTPYHLKHGTSDLLGTSYHLKERMPELLGTLNHIKEGMPDLLGPAFPEKGGRLKQKGRKTVV